MSRKNKREIKIRISEDLYNWLKWYAEKNDDSINHTTIQILKGRRNHTKEKPSASEGNSVEVAQDQKQYITNEEIEEALKTLYD